MKGNHRPIEPKPASHTIETMRHQAILKMLLRFSILTDPITEDEFLQEISEVDFLPIIPLP